MFNDNIILKVKSGLKNNFDLWLKKRLPPAHTHRLDRGNIFIFPSKLGCVYLLLVVLIFLLGTNYQNNVIILMSYLLASLFISVMLQSFFNLAGLLVSCQGQAYGYARQQLTMAVTVFSKTPRYDLNFYFAEQQRLSVQAINAEKILLEMPFYFEKRGIFPIGRITIKSEYSLGLFICWTHLDFGGSCIIYPEVKRLKGPLLYYQKVKNDHDIGEKVIAGAEDFFELKSYVRGESVNRVAWKQFARGQGKYTKHYHQLQGGSLWLTLKDMPGDVLETKLQYLCFLLLHYHHENYHYGLELADRKINTGSGDFHLKSCLRALAAYPQSGIGK